MHPNSEKVVLVSKRNFSSLRLRPFPPVLSGQARSNKLLTTTSCQAVVESDELHPGSPLEARQPRLPSRSSGHAAPPFPRSLSPRPLPGRDARGGVRHFRKQGWRSADSGERRAGHCRGALLPLSLPRADQGRRGAGKGATGAGPGYRERRP